jgi:hypothetical protein
VGENPTAIFIYMKRTVQNIYKGSYLKGEYTKKIKYLHESFKPRQELGLKLLLYSVLQKLELL